ncbi:VOC family protein [Marivirga salinae]|uniref:VOC family protein n=1 Tax=Marivirga salinarum TaxID=3059078 RepID=A0AA51NCD8_9BACT|nr:VOC family protein [Marivirga sp. BDSF4-3]WMN12515.1 VOC family protein [Marivirga sp. BDSF4-3]
MKKLFFSILFIFTIHLSQAQVKLNHIAVYVEDLTESQSFYSNTIGLEEIEEPFKDGLHVWYKLGSSQLHLIEGDWEEPTINKNNHLCFSIKDMNSFIENLKAENVPFENWIGESGKITNRVDGVKQIYFQDPNGYWVEVNDDY